MRSKNASIQQQETQVELAHKNFRPDFNVQYTYQHTASEFRDYYMATFGIRLPNRGRQKAELAEAQENQERAQKELDAESQRVLSEVQQQYVRAKTSEERLKIYSDGLVPQSEATFQSALSAYQSNRQDFESLLSGFLDVLNLDLEYRSEFVEHESALAELERLTGSGCAMNERDFRTNANEGSNMLRTENNNYRRAFWIALTTTVVLAIVASVLWWRLSHAGTASQPGNSSASRSMDAMAHTSAANASDSGPGSAGEAADEQHAGDSACANSAHASADAEHRHGAWEG